MLACYSAQSAPVWKPNAYEVKQLDSWFYHIDEDRTGVIKGAQAVMFLKKSNLHREILRKIWALVDVDRMVCHAAHYVSVSWLARQSIKLLPSPNVEYASAPVLRRGGEVAQTRTETALTLLA
mgnify:CR=1 FL=1